MLNKKTLKEYIQKRIEVQPNGCWNWVRALTTDGYPSAGINRKVYNMHRISYRVYVGPIRKKMTIDHLCRNTKCMNPAHLEQVTNRVNILRGNCKSAVNARKTHCMRGHEFNKENTKICKKGKGKTARACRTCLRAKDKRRWEKYRTSQARR